MFSHSTYVRCVQKRGQDFSYAYSWSFFTAGFGFVASEASAVVTISLFLRRNSSHDDMVRIIPGLEGKLADDEADRLHAADDSFCLVVEEEPRRSRGHMFFSNERHYNANPIHQTHHSFFT